MNLSVNWPPEGRYILAVSGGADSMVLLDLLARAADSRKYDLVVAHFDHGLRSESLADLRHVQAATAHYQLPFESISAALGKASEARARAERHGWLEKLRLSRDALAIITAHHQDDMIETSLLNLARGSGRRGLAPMQTGPILRPLSGLTRQQLRDYAAKNRVTWREDPTNLNLTNPRNFLRHRLMPIASASWTSCYLELTETLGELNKKITQALELCALDCRSDENEMAFPQQLTQDLSMAELEELLATACLVLQPDIELDERLIAELALFVKTASPHRRRPVRSGLEIRIEKGGAKLVFV